MNIQNSNKFKIIVAAVFATLVMASAGMAAAQGPAAGKGQGSGLRLERMAAHLNLTEEQQETIKSIHEKSGQVGVQLRKDLARLRNEMQGEMLKDEPSEKAVLSLNEKMGSLKTELKANRLKTRLAVREQLTPEQRDQMLTMRGPGHRGDGRGEGRAHGRRGGKNFGRGMERCDGSGPHARTECPQNNQ